MKLNSYYQERGINMFEVNVYRELFDELVERFEREEITYDEFIDQLNNCNEAAIEAIGEKTFNNWLNVRRDYVAFKMFNCNENQIVLF